MVVINLVGQSRFFKSKVRWQMTRKSLNLQGEDSIVLWGDLASTVRVYFSHWVTAQSRIVLSTQFHSVMGHFFSPSLGHWLVWQGLKGCQSHIMQSTDAKPSEIFQTSVLEWVFHYHHSGDVFHPDCFLFLFLNTLYLNCLLKYSVCVPKWPHLAVIMSCCFLFKPWGLSGLNVMLFIHTLLLDTFLLQLYF